MVISEEKKDGRKRIGNLGEEKAASYLNENGYELVSRNFRTRSGEIDIIAKKGNVLVFFEVKTFPLGTRELLERVLSEIKQKRIIKTAKCFLAKHRQYSNACIRFDVIVNDMPGLPGIYHIENAFAELI